MTEVEVLVNLVGEGLESRVTMIMTYSPRNLASKICWASSAHGTAAAAVSRVGRRAGASDWSGRPRRSSGFESVLVQPAQRGVGRLGPAWSIVRVN
jgi:hypothetical protein